MVINIDIGHCKQHTCTNDIIVYVKVDILGDCGIYTIITPLPQKCCIINT